MERLGVQRVVACALVLVSVGSLLPIWMTASWQLVLSRVCSSAWARAPWRWPSSRR